MQSKISYMLKAAVSLLLVCTFVFSPVFPTIAVAADDIKVGTKVLEGKYISLMGDSISSYDGWSNVKPIADESVKYRYGEAYYGLPGSGHHNETLLVSDTWWHQAATELGAEMLMVNSGNSTGLLHAKSSNAEWQNYLQGLLAYKSRPYYLGYEGKDPDVIALYIGSNEARMSTIQVNFGSAAAVDVDALITKNSDGTFTYAEPKTLAESYFILLHKVTVTYPDAEVYCFTIVPSCGGNINTVNTRTKTTIITNDIIKDAAEYYGVNVVDLFGAFGLDEDGDGKLSQEEFDFLNTCYNGDPHPNAKGFDVITEAFVSSVLKNSKYVAVETTAGNEESILTEINKNTVDGVETITRSAENFVTDSKVIVDFTSTFRDVALGNIYAERYSVSNFITCFAEGGKDIDVFCHHPELSVNVPLTNVDNKETDADETLSVSEGNGESKTIYVDDIKSSAEDGIYDYKVITTDGNGKISAKTNSVTFSKKPLEGQKHNLEFIHNDILPNETNDIFGGKDILPESPEEVPEISEGYDFVFIGCNQYSKYYTAFAYTTAESAGTGKYTQEAGGRTFYFTHPRSTFARRGLLVSKYYFDGNSYPIEGGGPAIWSSVQLFNLSDKNANLVSAYCIDQRVEAEVNCSYKLENLIDAGYYGKEETQKILQITEIGYWGEDSATGNFGAFKENLKNSGNFTDAELARITEGMAMTATQYAIWTYSNLTDNIAYISVYQADPDGGDPFEAAEEDILLVFKIYDYLISDKASSASDHEPETDDTIINEKNFIENVNIEVTGKPSSNPKNLDSDPTNDVYTADLSFTLKVRPSGNGDDLVMHLFDGDKPIAMGRVAGELQEGEVRLSHDGDRTYTFSGIEIGEGSLNLEFVLSGSQNLERGAFLFSSELGRFASQSMVGIAEGDFAVNVAMNIEFDFAADDGLRTVEHIWRTERRLAGRPVPPKDDEDDDEEEFEEKNPATGAPVFFG